MKQKNVNAHHQGYKQYGGKYGQRSVDGAGGYQPQVGSGSRALNTGAKIDMYNRQEYHAMNGAGSASSGVTRQQP